MNKPPEPANRKPLRALHLWEITAVREGLWLVLIGLLIWAAYALRALLAPILIALALAYVTDPVVGQLQRRVRVPRVVTALFMLLLLVAAASVFAVWLMPKLVQQLTELSEQLPVYWDTLQQRAAKLEASLAETPDGAAPKLGTIEPASVVRGAFSGVGPLFGVVGSAVGTASYLVVGAILLPVLFVFFATYYDRLAGLRRFFPASRRERICDLLKQVDAAFSGYVRGQLVVAVFTTIGFCIGFYLVGVPYWFVVALIGGTLSLVPYGQCTGLVLAIGLKYAETQAGPAEFGWLSVFIAPTLVYLFTQSMESWVITPLAQGEATNLHPIIVLVVLIIGGALAGIVGLILAVPVTASARMLFRELAVPRLERWADAH
jgi:predicted PurR-regulated permease PerM